MSPLSEKDIVQLTYYKVLTPDRKSIIVPDKIAVTYPLMEWTKPLINISKLMVFISGYQAQIFAETNATDYIIVPCYIKQSYFDSYLPIYSVFNNTTPEEINGFWQAFHATKAFRQCEIDDLTNPYSQVAHLWAPHGTVFADEVYCLK